MKVKQGHQLVGTALFTTIILCIAVSNVSSAAPTYAHRHNGLPTVGSKTTSMRLRLDSEKRKDSNTDNVLAYRGGEEVSSSGGSSSMTSSIFNLVNNVAGAGILTLAGGMAKGSSTGVVPAILINCVLGAISAYTFIIIGKACAITGEKDFKGLWGYALGENTTFVVDSMIAAMCLAACVIYSGILGDVFPLLMSSIGIPDSLNSRSSNILALTVGLLFPLGLVQNLSSLAFTSILGFASVLYTVLFLTIRSLDGTYSLEHNGKFVTSALKELPAFHRYSHWNAGFNSLVLVSNLALAYIAHYNSPSFYRELQNTSPKHFTKMVSISFSLLVSLYTLSMLTGYTTFGDVCQGNILLNYHPDDLLSTAARVATGFSILFGYPLVLRGAVQGVQGVAASLLGPAYNQLNNRQFTFLVASILTFVTIVAITVQDISLVVGLTGAVMGSFIVFICPALVYIKSLQRKFGTDSPQYQQSKYNYALIPLGISVAALGAFMTLKEANII